MCQIGSYKGRPQPWSQLLQPCGLCSVRGQDWTIRDLPQARSQDLHGQAGKPGLQPLARSKRSLHTLSLRLPERFGPEPGARGGPHPCCTTGQASAKDMGLLKPVAEGSSRPH